MEKKNNGSVDYALFCDIETYCKENGLDMGKFMNKALSRGFTILAYGETPMSAKKLNKPVEVVKIVEKVVEKIVKVSDDEKLTKALDGLQKTIDKQTEQISELEKEIIDLTEALDETENKKDMYGE